jgi:large subunit ribosomal protein L24
MKKTSKKERIRFHIKKNDLVEINIGEEKERRGRVLEILPEKHQAIIEGINLVKNTNARGRRQNLQEL